MAKYLYHLAMAIFNFNLILVVLIVLITPVRPTLFDAIIIFSGLVANWVIIHILLSRQKE